jgi:hypothetical protein
MRTGYGIRRVLDVCAFLSRQVNHVAVEVPIMRTKWSHVQITFTEANIKLTSFSHIDAMVITAHIDKWDVTSVLIDNRSQAEILFLSTF